MIPSRVATDGQALPSHALWNIAPSVPRPKMSRRFWPQAATAGGLLKTPPNDSQSSCDGRPGAAVPRLVEHRAVGAEAEDVQTILAPGGNCRRAAEGAAQ